MSCARGVVRVGRRNPQPVIRDLWRVLGLAQHWDTKIQQTRGDPQYVYPVAAPCLPSHTLQEMSVVLDRTLLLPTTAEHHVDEASPLFGHTLQSLEVRRGPGLFGYAGVHSNRTAYCCRSCLGLDEDVPIGAINIRGRREVTGMGTPNHHCLAFGMPCHAPQAVSAEIVVTFEASSELGDTFMARQSYLPTEVGPAAARVPSYHVLGSVPMLGTQAQLPPQLPTSHHWPACPKRTPCCPSRPYSSLSVLRSGPRPRPQIHWGHTFANILRQAPGAHNVRPGHFGDGTQHEVDLSR